MEQTKSTLVRDVDFKDLDINVFKNFMEQRSYFRLRNKGGDLFQHKDGLLVDMQSINVVCIIYDALSEENKARFNVVVCKDEYKLARFFDRMWGMIR